MTDISVLASQLLSNIWQFVNLSLIAGIPAIDFSIALLIVGAITGFLIRKSLKIIIVALLAVVVMIYFGLFGLSSAWITTLALQHGPELAQYGLLIFTEVPLVIGLIIGFVIG